MEPPGTLGTRIGNTQAADFGLPVPSAPVATTFPAEWMDRAQEMGGEPFWQNIRDPRAMSSDGGKTYTLVDEEPQDSDSGQPVHHSASKR